MRRFLHSNPLTCSTLAVLGIILFSATLGWAADWPGWRGPDQDGTSSDTGLISEWQVDGKNQLWRADFTGRSTPIVFDGRVCAIGRAEDEGKPITKREVVACFDAETGRRLWSRDIPVFLTTVPYTRGGWANVAGDPETGYVFVHGVGGVFAAYDRTGKTVWEHSLTEEYSRFSGFGGRTHTPIVDGDLVLLTFGVVGGWGGWAPPRHRYFAFDKRTGEMVWHANPGGAPADLNTYGVPTTATINGQRLVIVGNGDGYVYALQAHTGKLVWKFALTKRGINTAVVVRGDRVFAVHGEENVDEPTMGRTVSIDGDGTGDLTSSGEVWRNDDATAGFVSPVLHGDRLYVVNNSANMYALDVNTGKTMWEYSLGTVGKGSPVFADGKIYAPEVNGRFLILRPKDDGVEVLDDDVISMPEGRPAEIYSSPAIAYGRIYLATEAGLFCLGDPNNPFKTTPSPAPHKMMASDPNAQPAQLQAVPAEIVLRPNEKRTFRVRTFDAKGNLLKEVDASWDAGKMKGTIQGNTFTADSTPFQAGVLTAKLGDLSAEVRVRVLPAAPYRFDFESTPEGQAPPYFVGIAGRFKVADEDGNKVLVQAPYPRSHDRGEPFFGPPTMSGYTIQADMRGTRVRRKIPDFGLINCRYMLQIAGPNLQIFSWISEKRVDESVPFAWEPDTWYTMKLRVDAGDDASVIRGKVWKRGEAEPEEWMITARDPLAINQGSPGLFGVSRTNIYFDNIRVTPNG